jgi:UDP-glucuronate 4-epimerase
MLLASTSSAYGANEEMPYKENIKAGTQMSFYVATKKYNPEQLMVGPVIM